MPVLRLKTVFRFMSVAATASLAVLLGSTGIASAGGDSPKVGGAVAIERGDSHIRIIATAKSAGKVLFSVNDRRWAKMNKGLKRDQCGFRKKPTCATWNARVKAPGDSCFDLRIKARNRFGTKSWKGVICYGIEGGPIRPVSPER